MGMSDHTGNELEDKRTFLRCLIDQGCLEHGRSDDRMVIGITKQVIDRGEASLSLKQKFAFKQNVLDVFVTAECKNRVAPMFLGPRCIRLTITAATARAALIISTCDASSADYS
jgi:hypothetical protein